MRLGARELVFFAVLLGMPVAGYLLVFEPRQAEIEQARYEIEAKRAKLAELEAATRQIDDLGREIERLSEAIQMFEAKLPAEKEVEVILREVWELASAQGLTPRSVRTDRPIQSAQYSELPIRMVIVGNFDGFYSFLLNLERLNRITRIYDMKLTKVRNREGEMEASFTLTIFFEPQGASDRGRAS